MEQKKSKRQAARIVPPAPPAPPKPRPWYEVEGEVISNVWKELERVSPTVRKQVIGYLYSRNLAGG